MLRVIKHIFHDVKGVYKNFLHWNISKICIVVSTFLLALLLSMPFVISFFVSFYFSGNNWSQILSSLFSGSINIMVFSQYVHSVFLFGFEGIMLGLSILFFFIGIAYSRFLLLSLGVAYISDEKIGYFKNYYFTPRVVFMYLKMLFIKIVFLSIPFLILFVILSVLFFANGGIQGLQKIVESGNFNAFSVVSFVLFVITLLSFFYFSYRLLFAYTIFLDSSSHTRHEKSAFFYLKESFSLTKKIKKMWKFILIGILCFLLFFPLNLLINFFEKTNEKMNDFLLYKSASHENQQYMIQKDSNYYGGLEIRFSDISIDDLKLKSEYYSVIVFVLNILYFLLVYGLLEVIVVSFYVRVLKQ